MDCGSSSRDLFPLATVLAVCLLFTAEASSASAGQDEHPEIELFLVAASDARAEVALEQIRAQWRPGYAGMVWDLARLMRPPSPRLLRFLTLLRFLQEQTGQRFEQDLSRWDEWVWSQPYDPHPDYGYLKGQWYGQLDRRFTDFFPRGVVSRIRLDEIEWGGVAVNGIPPLEYPARIRAEAASYLDDDHIVFGIALGGEAVAYPKRILAWHEMALDRVGGTELTVVYCTLCGTVIPFESVVGGQRYTFGTSGLLYRSNKLMFDHETRSLWNTFEGIPVVGPLVDRGIQLTPHGVVTTTWGEWRRRHPDTTVLSLETGSQRNYAEGAAYRSYFRTDALMFPVSHRDDRLRNKEEVVVLRVDESATGRRLPLAITARLLAQQRLFAYQFAGHNLLVVTTARGANRVYDVADLSFTQIDDRSSAEAPAVIDATGRRWLVGEDALVLEADRTVRRTRIPAQRAFWFGWYAQFPHTVLVK